MLNPTEPKTFTSFKSTFSVDSQGRENYQCVWELSIDGKGFPGIAGKTRPEKSPSLYSIVK